MSSAGSDARTPPTDPQDILAQVERQFGLAADLFQQELAELAAGEPVSTAELLKTARSYLAAAQALVSMRKDLNDEAKRQAVSVQDRSLDLDQARDAVRRRLDRLRAAEDPSPIS